MAALPPPETYARLRSNLETVIKGQLPAIRKLLAAFAARGHVLLEDLPGTGKTTLAKAFARSLDLKFRRIQFTPDLLPSDIIGVSIFDQAAQQFRFYEGPLFSDVLLADEINRASPRTQSALLEAMGEGQVTIDGKRYELEAEFFVVATQNPIELHGTYPLPEAQMDRFAMRFRLGYLSPEQESEILAAQMLEHPLDRLAVSVDRESVRSLREAVGRVRVSDELRRYIVNLVAATRNAPGVQMGASPRASLTLMKASQALALFDGLEFVTPEQIHELAVAVIAHRLKLDAQARFKGLTAEGVVEDTVREMPVPV